MLKPTTRILITRILIRSLLGLFFAALLCAGSLYWFYTEGLNRPLPLSENRVYQLNSGSSLRDVGFELAEAGIFDYPTAIGWIAAARLEGKASRIKAGEYEIPAHSTPNNILSLFISGKTRLHTITLYEGWNFRQVMAEINKHPKLDHQLKGLGDAEIMEKLGYPGIHPEGRFFPETYYFSAGMTDISFLKRAYHFMEKELAQAWSGRQPGLAINNAEELLILASIIEKETGVDSEYPVISGVFMRRLYQGMRLQTDPTVIYGIGESFDGNLRRVDLTTDTPYNTYTRAGLPPTPISMPGRNALQGAANPQRGDELYFVAKGDGSHYFSATLPEHECAVITYQLKSKAPNKFLSQCRIYPSCPACQG